MSWESESELGAHGWKIRLYLFIQRIICVREQVFENSSVSSPIFTPNINWRIKMMSWVPFEPDFSVCAILLMSQDLILAMHHYLFPHNNLPQNLVAQNKDHAFVHDLLIWARLNWAVPLLVSPGFAYAAICRQVRARGKCQLGGWLVQLVQSHAQCRSDDDFNYWDDWNSLSMRSLVLKETSLAFLTGESQGIEKVRVDTQAPKSLLPHSVDQSNSQCQPRFEGEGKQTPPFTGRMTISYCRETCT